jgi:hypothetical protein
MEIKSPSQWLQDGGDKIASPISSVTPTSGIKSLSDFLMEEYDTNLQ